MPQPFTNAVMTNDGIALLTKAQAGEIKIEFTKMVVGNGDYTEKEKAIEQLQTRNALKAQKNNYPLSSVAVYKENSVKLTAFIVNYNAVKNETIITDGYYINEIGLIAKPQGGEDDTEVLYSIAVTSGEQGDFMPPYNGYHTAQITQDYYVTVNNSAEITIDSNGAPALAEDIQAVQTEMQAVKAQLGDHTVQTDVPEDAIFANMAGATETAAGQAGYVPAPEAGAQNNYLRGDGTWKPALGTLADVKANTQEGYLVDALAVKEAAGTVLTETLAAGATTLEFTDAAITDDSMIDVYADVFGVCPSAVSQEENTLTLTFDAQDVDVRVKVRVM